MAGVNYSIWVGDDGPNFLLSGQNLTWYQPGVPVGKMRWFTAVPGIQFIDWGDGRISGGPDINDYDEWIELTHVQHIWRSATESGARQLEVRVTIFNPRTDIEMYDVYAIYLAEQDGQFPLNNAF